MAVWQFTIELVPVRWAEANEYETDLLYGEDGYDTSRAWDGVQPTKDIDGMLGNIFPKKESWSEDLTIWGNEETHDINVWSENGKVFSIRFRLDLRHDITGLMGALVRVAADIDCVLFVPEKKIMFTPNVFELKQYIENSNAARFVKNPSKYLEEVKK